MSSRPGGHDEGRRAFVGLGFGHYTQGWGPLGNVADGVDYVEGLFTGRGFVSELTHLRTGGSAAGVRKELSVWLLDGPPYDELVIYWAGHGHLEGGHYLIATDSPPDRLTADNAVDAHSIATWLAKTPIRQVMLVIDACYAGQAAEEVSRGLGQVLAGQSPDDDRFVAIVTSAHSTSVEDGAFTAALRRVLDHGPPEGLDGAFAWTDHDERIHPESVAKAVDICFRGTGSDARTHYTSIGKVGSRIPNPRWRATARPTPADEARLARHALRQLGGATHFRPTSRGVDTGESGWFFSGREQVLRRAVGWLNEAPGGLFVVTGGPGAGKSAVLGRLATLADPDERRLAQIEGVLDGAPPGTVPEEHSFDLVIHATGLTAEAVAGQLADRFGLAPADVIDPARLVAAFARLAGAAGRRVTVLLDALEEAFAADIDRIARSIVRPLCRVPGVRVMVGTRRTRDAFATVDSLGGRGPLLAALNARDGEVLDLDTEPTTGDDIARYVVARLLDGGPDSPFNGEQALVQHAAGVVEARAEGSFLAARLHCRLVRDRGPRWLRDDPRWSDQLGTGLEAALRADLDRFDGPSRIRVRELLRPLAWAEGAGLPRLGVWPAVATELSRRFGSGATYGDDDVTWLLRTAGFHVLEAGDAGRTVYRLYHTFYAEFLRRETTVDRTPAEVHSAVVDALQSLAGGGWDHADRYLLHHLPAHATAARRANELLALDGYAGAADPSALRVALLAEPADGEARHRWETYLRVSQELVGASPAERASMLSFTSLSEQGPPLGGTPGRWVPRSVRYRPTPFSLSLTGHTGVVTAVAFGSTSEGRLLLASASWDLTVRVWDPLRAEPVGEPLSGHTGFVTGVAFGFTTDGRLLLASASEDHTVRRWDPLQGEPVDEPLTGHTGIVTAVAFGSTSDGSLLLASASLDGTVRLWDPLTGEPLSEPLADQAGGVTGVAFSSAGGPLLLATASTDGTVRLRSMPRWWPHLDVPVGQALTGDSDGASAVAFGSIPGGQLLLAAANRDHTVRVWDLLQDEPGGQTLTGHTGPVTAVAFGSTPEGSLLLASAGEDYTVRLWDPQRGELRGLALTGQTSSVEGVALGATPDGRLLLASANWDNTVRLWDPVRPGADGPPSIGRPDDLFNVTIGTIADGRLLAAAASMDHTVHVWDPLQDGAVGRALSGHTDYVQGLAFASTPDGACLLASASADGTVRLWDPFGGTDGTILARHRNYATAVAFGVDPDGQLLLASASSNGVVRVWDPVLGQLVGQPMTGRRDRVSQLVFGAAPGRLLLAAVNNDGTVRVWDRLRGKRQGKTLTGQGDDVHQLAFGSTPGGGLLLATASSDGTVRLWNLLEPEPPGETLTKQDGVGQMAFGSTADGRLVLAFACGGDSVQAWDPLRRKLVARIPLHATCWAVELSPRGLLAVYTSRGPALIDLR